jgi:hypothetical protein
MSPWGLNPYQYAGQDPLMYWDADGEQPGRFHPYSTLEEARVAANTDIFVATMNYGVEHSTRIYYSADAGGYFYTSPHFGSSAHSEGEAHHVLNRLNADEVLPDDAVEIEYSHAHLVSRRSSEADRRNAENRALDGTDSTLVDPDGNVRRITEEGVDEIVGTINSEVLGQMKLFQQLEHEELERFSDEVNAGVEIDFESADRQRALLMEWYKLSKDPYADGVRRVNDVASNPWKHGIH